MSILRAIAGTMATKGFGFLVTLAVGIILARSLGVAGKGVVDAVVAWSMLLLLAYPSLEEPQLYLLGRRPAPPSVFAVNGIAAAILFGLLVVLVFEAAVAFLPGAFDYREPRTGERGTLDPGLLRMLVWMSPLVLLQRILRGVLQGLGDIRSFNRIFLVQHGILLPGIVLGTVVLQGGAREAVMAHMVAVAASGVYAAVACLRHPDVRAGPREFRPGLLRTLVKGGVRLHGGVVAAFVILESDKIILLRFWGPAEVALYASAVAFTGHIRRLLLEPMKEVLGSRLPAVADDRERRIDILCKTCRHTLLLTLIPSIALMALGYPLLGLMYGREFLPAYGPLLVLVPASMLWTCAVIMSYWFIGSNRFLALTCVGVLVASINLVLNLLVVPRFGGMGAAATSLLAYFVHLSIFVWIIGRTDGVSWRRFLVPRREDLRVYGDVLARLKGLVAGPR